MRFPIAKQNEAASSIASLRNLGPKSAATLAKVGIRTKEDLVTLGAVGAYQLCREKELPVSKNMAYAIEGALMDVDWRAIPHEFRIDISRKIAIYEKNRKRK